MNKLMMGVKRFWQEEEGTEVVEWALVAGLIVAVGAAVFSLLGTQVKEALGLVTTELGKIDGVSATAAP